MGRAFSRNRTRYSVAELRKIESREQGLAPTEQHRGNGEVRFIDESRL